MEHRPVKKMEHHVRTRGDGMDSGLSISKSSLHLSGPITIDKNAYKSILKSLRPIEIHSDLIRLVPKYVPNERKIPKDLVKKSKEPKFVPYEPYKAAVKPIISGDTSCTECSDSNVKPSKNDIEIHELVNQMSEIRKIEMMKLNATEDKNNETLQLRLQWEKEKKAYEIDIKNLRETNSHLENQLKFQVKVNSELRTLLVAAVGEDLESRVQHLTEDKLALARALLNSANHLTSHQEQTEWLSGQCEVWRSKFLASSLMVEELAKWKSALSNRLHGLQETTKTLLGERRKVHNLLLKTCNALKAVSDELNKGDKQPTLKYGNFVDVAGVNSELAESLKKHLMITNGVNAMDVSEKTMRPTSAEKNAQKLLQNPVTIPNKQDILCKAVMGAASSLGTSQMYLQHPSLHSCCPHCKGEIQNI